MSSEISLDDAYVPESKVEPEVIVETTEEPVEVEAKEETVVEPEGEPTTPKKDEWTLTAVMDEREKRQAAVKENEALKKQLAEFDKPKDDVSIFDNEEDWKAQQEQKLISSVEQAKLDMSRAYAVKEFGEEKVAAAETWTETQGIKSPYVLDNIGKADLKYHKAIELMDEEANRQDPDAYRAQLKAEIMAELKAETSEEPQETITPSLASKRSTGGKKPTSEDFEDMLGA